MRATKKEIRERLATLTAREREVFELVIAGKMTKEIAEELRVTQSTIKHHRSALFQKMGARHVVELVNMAHSL